MCDGSIIVVSSRDYIGMLSKAFSKVYEVYTQFSLPFCALLDDVCESEDVVCTASSFSRNPAVSFLCILLTTADNRFIIFFQKILLGTDNQVVPRQM